MKKNRRLQNARRRVRYWEMQMREKKIEEMAIANGLFPEIVLALMNSIRDGKPLQMSDLYKDKT